MRILHTSDWHLGRSFGTQPLVADQRAFLGWLLDVVRDERIELVVVAGDVFDRAIPPAEAVEAWREHLVGLHGLGVQIVAIAGNHDHVVRLSAYDGLTDSARVWVRGGHERAGEVLVMDGSDGPLAVVPVPFLDPVLARALLQPSGEIPVASDQAAEGGATVADEVRPTHESVLRAALDRARAAVAGRRSLAIAHAWVQGGEQSESERMLTVGGTGQVDVSLFDGFSYAALGHLHRPQRAGGRETVRYSGSPLAYSFSEEHAKEVLLVDLDASGRATAKSIAVPVGRAVATITGKIDDLLSAQEYESKVGCWIRARLTDAELVIDARKRLQARFPYVVEVAASVVESAGRLGAGAVGEGVEAKSPFELSVDFWTDVEGEAPDDSIRELLRVALEGARLSGEQAS